MRFLLTEEDQDFFLKNLIYDSECSPETKEMVEGCKYFYFKIIGNSYFLAKDIKRQTVRNKLASNYLSKVFSLTEETNFYLEEFDSRFVDFFLQNYSSSKNSLDTDLYEIHDSYLSKYE